MLFWGCFCWGGVGLKQVIDGDWFVLVLGYQLWLVCIMGLVMLVLGVVVFGVVGVVVGVVVVFVGGVMGCVLVVGVWVLVGFGVDWVQVRLIVLMMVRVDKEVVMNCVVFMMGFFQCDCIGQGVDEFSWEMLIGLQIRGCGVMCLCENIYKVQSVCFFFVDVFFFCFRVLGFVCVVMY